MSWSTLQPDQCISFDNLQNGYELGLFLRTQPIPSSSEQITKQNFEDYVIVPASVSQYPSYVNKTQNQLVIKDDVALYGNATLVPKYGISFTGLYYYDFTYQIPLGIWSLPASSTQISQYYSSFGIGPSGSYGANYLYVEVDGTSTSPSGFFSVTLSVNGNVISDGTFYYVSGPQYALIFFNEIIYAPNDIEITIIDGQATPINFTFQDQNGGIPITSVAASRGSGQYQMVATGANGYAIGFLQGRLYRSIDYGATWQASSTNTLYYWDRIAISDTGQYMIAGSLNGPLFLSSNYGASYTDITTRIRGNATEYFEGIGISGNGQYIIVCYETGNGNAATKISNNYGDAGSWSVVAPWQSGAPKIQGIAISYDGQYMYLSYTANGLTGIVTRSSNYGANWQDISVGTQFVRDVSCSSDGSTVMVTGATQGYDGVYLTRGFMFKSTNYGASYTGIQSGDYLRNWARVGQLYTVTTPYSGYGTIMTYFSDASGGVTFPAETYPMGGDTLGSVVNSNTTGMGQRVFTDCAVGGTNGVYRLLGSTTGLFRSVTGGGSWTQL
jgi:hypothetical protein